MGFSGNYVSSLIHRLRAAGILQPKEEGIMGLYLTEEGKKVIEECSLQSSESEPDWTGKCSVCESCPILPATQMCGPCSFGEAETVGGNW